MISNTWAVSQTQTMTWTSESLNRGMLFYSLRKIWKSKIKRATKTKVFKACVESILLYGSESWTLNVTRTKRLDGTYTKTFRSAYDLSWKDHPTIATIYGRLSRISQVVRCHRLALAGHVSRHDEPAGKLITWVPEENRRVGRPFVTLRHIIEEDTGLSGNEFLNAMSDRDKWRRDFVCFT